MFSFQQKVVFAIGGISILSMLYFLSSSFYEEYKLQNRTEFFEERNKKISSEISEIQSKVDYYDTDNYRDKYAKEVLNKVNPGEKVIILSSDTEEVLIPYSQFLNEDGNFLSAFENWKIYFFGKETLEERAIK